MECTNSNFEIVLQSIINSSRHDKCERGWWTSYSLIGFCRAIPFINFIRDNFKSIMHRCLWCANQMCTKCITKYSFCRWTILNGLIKSDGWIELNYIELHADIHSPKSPYISVRRMHKNPAIAALHLHSWLCESVYFITLFFVVCQSTTMWI